MWDLAPMSIFINHSLYVSYSSFSNIGLGCYKLPPQTPDILIRAMSYGAPVPRDLVLLGGSDTVCNDSYCSLLASPNQTSQEVIHPGTTLVEARLTAEFW